MSTVAIAAVATAAALLAASCSDFKSDSPDEAADAASDGARQDGASDDDGATDKDASSSGEGSAGTATGPGVHGALPSGYCCSSDDECRFRNCATINGSKMCADVCSTSGGCDGDLPGFACAGASSSTDGQCEPTSTTVACVPASKFVHGTKKLGACCTALHSGKNGTECEGGHCSSFGNINNPYICINACSTAADCPGNYKCTNTGSGYSICLMLSDPYTCDK